MKINLLVFSATLCLFSGCMSPGLMVQISSNVGDAQILQNGQEVGRGNASITIPRKQLATIQVKRAGYVPAERTFYNRSGYPIPSNFVKIDLIPDEAWSSSVESDVANRDFALKPNPNKFSETDAWKLINKVITTHFDEIEENDITTGYLRTAVHIQNFNTAAVRTRIIIKGASEGSLLVYKVKVISQIAPAGTSVKVDEAFRDWDRVLKRYATVVSDLQDRLK